ncbi:MAG: amino acid permease [Chloroflexi bacterium]|nr:amino acid permease [Chloroflexota bacterium]
MRAKTEGKITLAQAVAMAVGTMIGASIFSLLGVGAQLAGSNLPLSFVLSGILALMVAYSYAILGRHIVSNAGPIAFILRGFGDSFIVGVLAILMWMSYVISIALFAKGFAGYLLPLLGIAPTKAANLAVITALLAVFTALNATGGSQLVGRLEFSMVLIKIGILVLFVLAGLVTLKPERLIPQWDPAHIRGMLNAALLFFLSYMGFGLVTNASENMEDPERNVPRAIYLSILIVMVIYVSVAAVAVGNLTVEQLAEAKENALAIAAQPALGRLGFTLVSVGALISITSALNATLYGGANVAYAFARDGLLPETFERKRWFEAPEGLYLTAGLGWLFAVGFRIESVASFISLIFTAIYLAVLLSHWRLVPQYGGDRRLLAINITALSATFVGLVVYQWRQSAKDFGSFVLMLALVVLVEVWYRYRRQRHLRLPARALRS